MRVLLIDFSGTGNTSLCGKYIAESFIKHGHEAIHYTYKKDVSIQEDFDSYDLIGFGYPIHAFNVPEAFNKYIKAAGQNQKADSIWFRGRCVYRLLRHSRHSAGSGS